MPLPVPIGCDPAVRPAWPPTIDGRELDDEVARAIDCPLAASVAGPCSREDGLVWEPFARLEAVLKLLRELCVRPLLTEPFRLEVHKCIAEPDEGDDVLPRGAPEVEWRPAIEQ